MKNSQITPFTQTIRDGCAAGGISIREFLRRAGLPTSALYRWETGHVPQAGMVELVERVLKEMEDNG